MRIVNNYGEGLSAIDTLAAARNTGKIENSFGDDVGRTIASIPGGCGSEHVVDIHVTDHRSPYCGLARGTNHLKAGSALRDVDRLGMEVAGRQPIGEDHGTLLLTELLQLPPVFIINVQDGTPWRICAATFE